MSASDRIPLAAATRLRQFRIQVLPVLVLLGTVAGTIQIWRHAIPATALQGQVESAVSVVRSPASGTLVDFKVELLQTVSQGYAIGRVLTTGSAPDGPEQGSVLLEAPITGSIAIVHRHSGETVMAGDPVVTLAGPKPGRIIAYLPQPLRKPPTLGARVEIRTRSFPPVVLQGKVIAVGSRMESIPGCLRPNGTSAVPELGLPIMVSRPCHLEVVPGEIVDLRLLDSTL